MWYSYKLPSNLVLTTEDIRALAYSTYEQPKALLELPLILVPKHLFEVSDDIHRELPVPKAAINEWMGRAKEEDERLRIERRWIPYAEIYIPHTPIGLKFYKLAKAIGEIPTLGVIPKNQNQAYWLKTLHYYWQAKGVIFAHKLLGVIRNPVEPEGVLGRYLPNTSLKNLELDTNIDLACFRLLVRGGQYIRNWAATEGIPYPFNNPMELFLEIQKQSFLTLWQLSPCNSEHDWLPNAQQRDNISARIKLLEKKPWLETAAIRETYPEAESAYLEFLREADWYGYWLLALRDHFDEEEFEEKQISSYWKAYIEALKAGKELFLDEFDWRNGEPHKTRTTNRVQRVEGSIDPLGHILWFWA